MQRQLWILMLAWPACGLGSDPVEELPPPRQQTPQETPQESPPDKSVVVSRQPATGSNSSVAAWGLIGPSGRHYCVGATAIADYVLNGQRRIVALEAEDPAGHATTAESFFYFREPESGCRWAIARQASSDQRFRVFWQAAGEAGLWRIFHRAQPTWQPESEAQPAPLVIWRELTCGSERSEESVFFWP